MRLVHADQNDGPNFGTLRANLRGDVQAFVESGGTVQVVPSGQSGWRELGYGKIVGKRERAACEVGGCDRWVATAGKCTMHYHSHRTGRPMDAPMRNSCEGAFSIQTCARLCQGAILRPASAVGVGRRSLRRGIRPRQGQPAFLTRPLVGVKKLLGFTSLTAMSMIVPMADCAGRALAGLLAPCTRGPRARTCSLNRSPRYAFGREHAHRAKILRDHHGPWCR